MKKRSLRSALRLAALAGLVLLGACVGDGDDLITGDPQTPLGGTLFARYVAMGNSLTAGFQSNGFNDSLQARAYPVLLAQRAGASFTFPAIARPGCPVPFGAPLSSPIATTPSCVRVNNPRIVNNVAVPGARMRDLTRFPGGNLGQLNVLITGGRTQARAMIETRPTFVSAWAGNNDALSAVITGFLGPQPGSGSADSTLTPLAAFQTGLNILVDSIRFANPQGVMLVGVVDAIRFAPLVQPGAYFYLARDPGTGLFQGKSVNANCSPVNNLGQPNPLSANMVSFLIVSSALLEINCDPSQQGGAFLLDPAEMAVVTARINAFNQALQTAATANNWLYVNPNEVFLPFLLQQDGSGRFQQVRKCQLLPTATTAAQLQAAVLNSCPVTGPTAAPNFFGAMISFDGIHPSTAGQTEFAKAFAQRINQRYGTSLSTS